MDDEEGMSVQLDNVEAYSAYYDPQAAWRRLTPGQHNTLVTCFGHVSHFHSARPHVQLRILFTKIAFNG